MSVTPPRSTSLSPNRRLLEVNISPAAETGLAAAVRAARARRWQQDHAAAIADYNAFIDAQGIPFGAFRKF